MPAARYAARFEDLTDPAALGPRWRAVEAVADDPSFFLRWTWIGNWIDALATAGIALPQLLVIEEEGRDIALALIGRGRARRKLGVMPALWLNESGDREGDRPFIEYNGLISRKGCELASVHAFCESMALRRDWCLLQLSALRFGSPLTGVPGIRRRTIRDASAARYVDLEAVRSVNGDYLSLLGAGTRAQIRRSLKDEPGTISIDTAHDPATADQWLDAMRHLAIGRHADNAWESAFFRNFARRVVLAGLKDGSVELLRLAGGGEALGYLLNFVSAGRVMNYQSAFAPPRAAKSKPGLMCHSAAVAHYAVRGLDRYSFLAGKDRYKENLSTHGEELIWWTLERFDWRLEAEAVARRLFRVRRSNPAG